MGRLSTDLMESLRWLQLAEMELVLSKPPWRGEMEKSAWGCGGTPLGLLRILITWRSKGESMSIGPWIGHALIHPGLTWGALVRAGVSSDFKVWPMVPE